MVEHWPITPVEGNKKIQQANEFSLSQILILGGSFGEHLNNIEAGWQISPDLYGDNNTRIGIRSDDLADTFEKVVKGCIMALSSPRLVIPATIYGLWGLSQHFANDYFQLDKAWSQSNESGAPIDIASSLRSYEYARRLRVAVIHGLARMAAIMASTYKAYLGVGLGPLSFLTNFRIPHPGRVGGRVVAQYFASVTFL